MILLFYNQLHQTGAEATIRPSIQGIDKQLPNNKKNVSKNNKNTLKVDYSNRRQSSGWSAPIHPISCQMIKARGKTFKWILLRCRSSVDIKKIIKEYTAAEFCDRCNGQFDSIGICPLKRSQTGPNGSTAAPLTL